MRRARLDLGPSIPGWMLRAAILPVAFAGAAGLTAPTGWVITAVCIAALGAMFPQTGGTWIAAAMLPLFVLFFPVDHGRAAVAVAAVHLLHVLAGLSLVVRMRTIVALRALLPTVRRFVIIQLVAQSALAFVLLVPTGGSAAWAAIVGACAVLALAVGAVIAARERPSGAPAHSRRGADVGGPS